MEHFILLIYFYIFQKMIARVSFYKSSIFGRVFLTLPISGGKINVSHICRYICKGFHFIESFKNGMRSSMIFLL